MDIVRGPKIAEGSRVGSSDDRRPSSVCSFLASSSRKSSTATKPETAVVLVDAQRDLFVGRDIGEFGVSLRSTSG